MGLILMEKCNLSDKKIIEECRNLLLKKKIAEEDRNAFIHTLEALLCDYEDVLGPDQEIHYWIWKRIDCVECKIYIKADEVNPFVEGEGAEERNWQKMIVNLGSKVEDLVSYRYLRGINVVTIRSARKAESSNIFKQPMVIAALGGLILGLVCQQLPEDINHFIVDEISTPILNISLSVMAGIMGPVIFFTIVKAVSNLDNIEDLTGLGSKVLKRFLFVTLCISVISSLFGIIFFPLFGNGSTGFSLGVILEFLYDIVPISLVAPFVENNVPQLAVLGIGMGAVLLKLGDRVGVMCEIVDQLAEWLIGFMNSVLVIMPVVPFLSIMNIVAKGEVSTFIRGWKFILACYIAMAACYSIKIIKVCLKCKINYKVLWRKTKPVIMKAFSTGSSPSAFKMCFEVSEKDLGINPIFSNFWIPLSNGMLDPTCTMFFALAPYFVAELTGTSISISFILIVIILSIELSMASPGLIAGYAIIFPALGMSAEYVGLFSAFSIVTRNFSAGCCTAYRMFEQIEAACKTGNIDMSCFEPENDSAK